MTVAVKKWGNSLAVRLPKDIAREIDLQDNTPLEIEVKENKIVLTPTRKSLLNSLIEQINTTNLHKEIEADEGIGSEEW